jgi:hypothetical protein
MHQLSLQWRRSSYSDATIIGEVTLPKHQTSHVFSALFEKIYDGQPILTVFSNIGEDVQYLLFQISLWCENVVAAQHYAVICKQLLNANDRNRVRWVVLGLPQDGACTDLFENPSEISLKGGLTNATTFNPLLFSLDDTFEEGSEDIFLVVCVGCMKQVT